MERPVAPKNWEELKGITPEGLEDAVESLLAEMTLDEKIEQMNGDWSMPIGLINMVSYCNPPIPAGGIKRLGIPPILFTDGPRGIVTGHATCFPVSMARGATWDVDLEERIGQAIAREGLALGANFFGGVCINLLRHPAWGRAQETYGEDPHHVGEFGAALVRGVQGIGMMACVKHYALNSMENSRFKVDISVDERTLREVYLPHFKKCIDAGAASVMGAYNKFRGDHACESKYLLTTILKDEWGFEGFVISDFLLGVRDGAKAIAAGLDIEMPLKWKTKPRRVKKALKRGQVTMEMIEEANRRILRQKARFLALREPGDFPGTVVACPEHIALALEAARKSIVLLKNDAGLLPIDKDAGLKIGVFGKLASVANIGDHGSSRVHPPRVVTPLEGLKKVLGPKTAIVTGGGAPTSNPSKARKIAADVDVCIVFAGYTHGEEGEYLMYAGGDRKSLRLPKRDVCLINAVSGVNDNCIVVIEGGSATIVNEWKDKVKAIIMAWYPGMEGGTAIAEVICGDVNPSGKLPFTIPRSEQDLPPFKRDAKSFTYDYYHGYRLLDKHGVEPDYPFGHGLSYTSFTFNGIETDKDSYGLEDIIEATVRVTNIGDRHGDEVIQVYVSCRNPDPVVEHPVKELKAFARISLAPGETKRQVFNIPVKDLACFDDNSGSWLVEPGDYLLLTGGSSRDDKLVSCKITIS